MEGLIILLVTFCRRRNGVAVESKKCKKKHPRLPSFGPEWGKHRLSVASIGTAAVVR
jgi:hypothetical protein